MDGLKGIIQRLTDERDDLRRIAADATDQAEALDEAITAIQGRMQRAVSPREARPTAHNFEKGSLEAHIYGAVALSMNGPEESWSLDGLYQELKYSVPTTTKSRILTILRKYINLYREDDQGRWSMVPVTSNHAG